MTKVKNNIIIKLKSKSNFEGINTSKDKWRSSGKIRTFIFILTVLLCSFFFSFHIDKESSVVKDYSVNIGSTWQNQTVIAERDFPLYKDINDYNKEVDSARKNALRVYNIDKVQELEAEKSLEILIEELLNNPTQFTILDNENIEEETLNQFILLGHEQKKSILTKIQNNIKKYLSLVYRNGFVYSLDSIEQNYIAILIAPNHEKIHPKNILTDTITFIINGKNFLYGKIPEIYLPISVSLLKKIVKPNLLFSPELTEQSIKNAENSVARTEGIITKGTVIIEKGQKLSEQQAKVLKSYMKTKYLIGETGYTIWMFLGSILHSSIILFILIIYLFILRKRIWGDNFRILILILSILFVSLLSWISVELQTKLPVEFLILLPALSMLIAIVFDSRTAFYSTVVMALMVAGIRGSDYEVGISLMFAGTLAAYTVRDIQSRTQIYKSIFFIFIGLVISAACFSLENSSEAMTFVVKLLFSLINSALSPLLTFGLLFIIENISNITTDLKLDEFDNINHPLLIKLNEVAPGTYQHTMSLAVLAEKCAIAIGANPLLTKLGAYFHDIGKISRPEFFAENQIDSDNKLNLIPPKKAAEIIRKHVIEGVRIAKEYKLPQSIIDFIPMHHGTSLIKHFYARAKEEANGTVINENEFRYPGPKPYSKETAILMICDSAEAISRIITLDREDLEELIKKTIDDKLLDGQFNESNLSFKELEIIKNICIKNLAGASHQRIEYKDIPNEKP